MRKTRRPIAITSRMELWGAVEEGGLGLGRAQVPVHLSSTALSLPSCGGIVVVVYGAAGMLDSEGG